MLDTLTGYLALNLGGLPSSGLYSGVNGFSLVRGCDGRRYRLKNCYILGYISTVISSPKKPDDKVSSFIMSVD